MWLAESHNSRVKSEFSPWERWDAEEKEIPGLLNCRLGGRPGEGAVHAPASPPNMMGGVAFTMRVLTRTCNGTRASAAAALHRRCGNSQRVSAAGRRSPAPTLLQLSPPREIRRKDLESISTTPRFLRCVPTMACASLLAFVLLALATVAGSSNGGGIGEGFRSAGLPRGFEEVNFEHFRKSLATLWQRLTSRDPAELAAKLAIELGSQQLARCTRLCNASGPPLLLLLLARCALPSEPAR